jgi:hypothetical protein
MKPLEILDEYSDTDPAIIDHLIDKGYKQIGQGVDQTAFLEPGTGLVLKIFGTQDTARAPDGENTKPTFSEDHMMFFRWAKYCNNHKSNPYLPKFSGFESFYWNGQVYLQIRQEQLFKLNQGTAMLCREMADYATAEYNFDGMAQNMADPGYWHQDAWTNLIDILSPKGLKVFYKTIVKLESIANEMGYELDLHEDNFMARADSTPVIVDPWVV